MQGTRAARSWGFSALLLSMSFSYTFGANPAVDYPRLLISDTVEDGHIFEDQEINAATLIQANVFQSAQFYSGVQGAYLPSTPVSYLRIAALLLDSLASNRARLANVVQILDVKLDPSKASEALRDQAKNYREIDDDSGAIMIIEQVNDIFSFRDRFWKQVQRQQGGGF